MSEEPQRMTSKRYRDMMASKGRRRGNPTAGPNKTEQAFGVWRAMQPGVQELQFKAIKLRIGSPGSRCWYEIDWFETNITTAGFELICWDVKARGKNGKPRVEDDALVKIKAVEGEYTMFRFAQAWPDGQGGWDIRWF